MNDEVVIGGIGVIASCIIGGWQLWPSMSNKREKFVLSFLLISVSATSLSLVVREIVSPKGTTNIDRNDDNDDVGYHSSMIVNSDNGYLTLKNLKIKIPENWEPENKDRVYIRAEGGESRGLQELEGWTKENKNDIYIEPISGEPENAQYIVKNNINTDPYLIPRVRIWKTNRKIGNIERYIDSLQSDLRDEYKENVVPIERKDGLVKGVKAWSYVIDDKTSAILLKKRISIVYEGKSYEIFGTSGIEPEHAADLWNGMEDIWENF